MALAALVLMAAAVAAGCSSGPSVDTIANAATKTTDQGGSKIALRGTISGDGVPRAVRFTGQGAIDGAKKRGRLTLDLSQLAGVAPGIDPSAFKVEEIIDGLVLYMRSPLLSSRLPGNRRWIKLDLQKATQGVGVDLGQLSQLGQNDPGQSLQYLRAVSGDVEEVGEEKVRGVPTTHYRATVDLRKYPGLVPQADRERARQGVERLIDMTGRSRLPTEVWVDEKGLIRRQVVDFAMRSPLGQARMKQDIELYDFGTRVDADPPPADQTFDVTNLAARGARQRQGQLQPGAP